MGQFRQEEVIEDLSNLFDIQENQEDQGLLQEKSCWYRKHSTLNNVQWATDQDNATWFSRFALRSRLPNK